MQVPESQLLVRGPRTSRWGAAESRSDRSGSLRVQAQQTDPEHQYTEPARRRPRTRPDCRWAIRDSVGRAAVAVRSPNLRPATLRATRIDLDEVSSPSAEKGIGRTAHRGCRLARRIVHDSQSILKGITNTRGAICWTRSPSCRSMPHANLSAQAAFSRMRPRQ